MFNELPKTEQQAFIDSLDESDMTWLDFLTVESGGMLAVGIERLYKLKLAVAEQRGEEGGKSE